MFTEVIAQKPFLLTFFLPKKREKKSSFLVLKKRSDTLYLNVSSVFQAILQE